MVGAEKRVEGGETLHSEYCFVRTRNENLYAARQVKKNAETLKNFNGGTSRRYRLVDDFLYSRHLSA